MYHYSELANAVRIKNRQQDGSDPFADYSDEELANAYQTKYPELSKQINWGMNYSGQLNRAASTPQMVLPGGRIARAPAVGVFADPVSPESMGARVTLQPPQASPVRPQMAAESTAVRRLAPAVRPAVASTVWAEEQGRRAQMAQPTLTEGQRAAQEERNLVKAHEAEYQAYMDSYKRQRAAEGSVRSDGSLRDGSFPLSRDGFAQTVAGYPVDGKFWMPAAMRPQRTHEKTVWQGLGKVTEDASRVLTRPAIETIGAVAGVEPGFSDLSHASNVRRNLETRAQVDDLRKLQEANTPLSPEQRQYLEENDPGVVAGTIAAVKEIPGMAKGIATNPEQARAFAESMAVDFPLAIVLSAGFGEALTAVRGFDKARRLRNVAKSINGRVTKGALTTEQAEALTTRFLQSKDGVEAIKEARELYAKRGLGTLAKDFAKETVEESAMDAVAETINGHGRGENSGLVENFVSGLPLDAAPFVAKNAANGAYRLAKEGANPGLTKDELNAVFGGNLDLTPAYRAKSGLPVAPVGNQKTGSTATRPQVEALKNRPGVRSELKQLAALARNPETAATLYRLSGEDLSVDMTEDQLKAASYGGLDAGSQDVRGFAQELPHYQYDKDGNGAKSARTVATIGKSGGKSTVAHETIHGIENRLRSEAYGSNPSTEAARLVDMVDDWTERAYEWGRKNDVILPGPKELLTQAMTYRLGWDDDFDKSVKALPMPDEMVEAFASRAGEPMRGGSGLRKDGVKMDDMPLPEKPAQQEAQAEPQDHDLAGIEIPELDEGEELPFSFAGRNARTADQGARAEAERRLDAELNRRGVDGIVDEISGGFAVFSPTQIKSATGNRGTFDEGDADIRYSLAKSDPRQKILSNVTRSMRENGLKPMAQNDMSSEWRTFSKKGKADPVQRAKEVKAWDAVEESLRRFVADNPAIAAEAGLRPPTEGHLDEFDVADAVDRFRGWTNSSTQGKFSSEELDHFAQASDAAQNGPGATEHSDHPMTKRRMLSIAKTNKMGNMIRFESLGEKFNAKWAPEKKAWVVTRAGGNESFEIPRDGSVWVDGERARAPEFDEDAYPLRDDRNLRAANAEQTAMGEGDLEKSESEESRLDALARHVQDSMRDLRKLQERVKNKEADPYREYDLAAGRGDHSGAKMREKFLRPILQLMEKHGLEQKTVDSYLYARHAAERNKSVAEKNPDFQDGGSGMKTKDAEEILQNFAMDAVRNQALESIGKISDKLNEWRLDMQVKSGLLSEVDAKARQAAWKHYIPLRGIPGDEDARPGVFRGKVAKQDKKKAMGRKSKAESVLAQNFAVTLDAIVNAQRNIAARELWKLAQSNPDSKYWELDPSYVRNVQGKDGQVTQMADLQRMQKAPGIVPVFIKGEPHYIEFKTPEGGRIAAAIKELNQEQSNTLIRGLGKVNRFVGSMITQYSPEFVLTNFSRDYLTALTVAFARDGVKIARRMVTQAPAAVVGLARSEMGLRNDWTDWKERWESAGGKVGFMQSKDFKSLADDIEDDLKDLNRSNYNPKKWANVVGKVVESANGSVESATRLAYFRALVENGVDEKVAAQKSKELTVNFNRRGDWKWANQFWMFFNASVQGSANIAKLFTDKDPDVRKRAYAAAGAIASAGAAVALYNQFLGGEDEDSGKTHYERLPGWAKNNAAVLLNPKSKDGSALTIPLPYGLNVIWNTGRMMAEGASRQDGFTAMDAASEIAGSIVGSFSPFGADIDPGNIPGTLLGLATPTAAKPWMELALNKNFAGRPVMPENIPGMVEKPESELYFQGVNPYARELAAFLNTETGGDKWHAGNVSVSPEKMENVFNAYTGGVGRILQQGLGIAKTWGEGNETTIRQWPFARRFFSSAPEGVDRSAFMAEVLTPAKQDMAQLKDLAKSEDADVDQFVDEHYANIVASAAFGGLKTKEKRLKRAEELGEQIGPGGVKDEYRSFFAKAWKAKREMDTLQEEHNSTTDQAKRAELRKRIEKEAEKAFEGFGE